MVLKTLLDTWRSGVVMRHMYDELLQMVQATEWMFQKAGRVLLEGLEPDKVAEDLYATDRKVNKTERKVRKEIVEHLSIRPKGDVPACLVLMSVVKDAERIGDYCKNLYEVRDILGASFGDDESMRQFREIYDLILKTFRKTQRALRDSDEDLAREIMESEKKIAHDLEQRVRAVANSDMNARDAVCRALALRHMKRIHGHLFNIASSIVQPVHKIDYFDGKPFPPRDDDPETPAVDEGGH